MKFKIDENGNIVIVGKLKTNKNNAVNQHTRVVPYDIWHKGNTHLMKTKENIPYGYSRINGQLKIDFDEARKVKFLFNKYLEYEEHPPLELIKIEIESAMESGEWISYSKAKQRISSEAKKLYILKELRNL